VVGAGRKGSRELRKQQKHLRLRMIVLSGAAEH
jgi:hypothetical protein